MLTTILVFLAIASFATGIKVLGLALNHTKPVPGMIQFVASIGYLFSMVWAIRAIVLVNGTESCFPGAW